MFGGGGGAGAAAIPLYFLRERPTAVLVDRFRNERPARWRMPINLPEPEKSASFQIKGRIREANSFVSQFSGRDCIACKISVLFDVKKDARPPQWALTEMQSCDFSVDGMKVKGDRAMIMASADYLESDQISDSLDLEQFLKKRGLFLYDGDFFLFETIIENGDTVETRSIIDPETCYLQTYSPG